MKKKIARLITLAAGLMLAACATMPQDKVQPVDTRPVVSKTVEAASPSAPKGLKRKVAVARFTNETKYGQSFFVNKDDDRVGKQAVDILSSRLLWDPLESTCRHASLSIL